MGPQGPQGEKGDTGETGGITGGTMTGPLIYTATGSSAPRSAQDRAAVVANVLDFGALGDNSTDDTAAIRAAVSVIRTSGGGTLFFPAGSYRTSAPVLLPSNTLVRGVGPKSLLSALSAWTDDTILPGTARVQLSNANYGTVPGVDHDSTIESMAFRWVDPAPGDSHSIRFFGAKNVAVRNCLFHNGGDAIAFLAVNNGSMEGNHAYQFTNCAYDVWARSTDIRIIGNHAESSVITGQLINFNASGGASLADPNTSSRCIISHNTLINTGSGAGSINIDPLLAGNTVTDVVVSDNTVVGGIIHFIGDVRNAVIANNIMRGVGTLPAIYGYVADGVNPSNITVLNNLVIDPQTSSGSIGVIRVEANGYLIQGNTVTGTAHWRACYTAAFPGTVGTNNFSFGASGLKVSGTALVGGKMIGTTKSGVPATTDLAQGEAGVFKDSAGATVVLAYNAAGTIKKVALV